jgi:hypothetical protein
MYTSISKKDIEILEALIDAYGEEAVLNEISFSKKNVIGGLASLALGMGLGLHDANKAKEPNVIETPAEKKEVVVKQDKPNNPYGMSKHDYELFQQKTAALRDEIRRVFEKRNIPMEKLRFSPEHMVYMSYLYDFDLPLMISQSRLETCFGTEGVGAKCNSLFSIGAHDKNPTRVKYSSLDDSVEPYIKTVQNNYLLNGKKSVDDLLWDGYVNGAGNRYASNTEYEQKLRQIRDSLIKTYPVMAKNFRKD